MRSVNGSPKIIHDPHEFTTTGMQLLGISTNICLMVSKLCIPKRFQKKKWAVTPHFHPLSENRNCNQTPHHVWYILTQCFDPCLYGLTYWNPLKSQFPTIIFVNPLWSMFIHFKPKNDLPPLNHHDLPPISVRLLGGDWTHLFPSPKSGDPFAVFKTFQAEFRDCHGDFTMISDWWFGKWILFFHSVGNVIIPTVELHHFSKG